MKSYVNSSHTSYRDKIYIVKDVILKLVEWRELTQTSLVSYCGLNLTKHRWILDEMELNGLIERSDESNGKRRFAIYRPTIKGMQFCNEILEVFERMFPRRPMGELELGK